MLEKRILTFIVIFFYTTVYADVLTSTYNIKWLGYSKQRDNAAIAQMLSDAKRDLVFIQEVVAPPINVQTNDILIKADDEVSIFFNEMSKRGYSYVLSPEDTGTGKTIHKNSSATEWFVAFYNPQKLVLLNSGYIAPDRSDNADFERVPYWFAFREISSKMDFVVVSTHLMPGKGKRQRLRRYHELNSIFTWINERKHSQTEKDFIVLGDMNVYDCDTLDTHLKDGFKRANTDCLASNLKMNEPYDQVLFTNYSNVSDYEVVDMYKVFDINRSTVIYNNKLEYTRVI